MKFKKTVEYPSQAVAALAPEEKREESPRETLFAFECVACTAMASVLHRGTSYCRSCYDRRAYRGELVN